MVEKSILVQAAMRAAPLELPVHTTMRQACAAMRARRVEEALVVVDGTIDGQVENVIGIVTESDCLDLIAHHATPADIGIEKAMTGPVHTIAPTESVDTAMGMLHALRIHRLPVVENRRIIGLLTRDGLLSTQNARLSDFQELTARLQDEAHHDVLTGLANRRLFNAVLEREIALQERTGRGLGMLMIDIDHFKTVNDTYGHPRGDIVLQELARRLQSSVRRSDLVARVGGEEFAVLVTTPTSDSLMVLGEKLREIVEVAPFIAPDEELLIEPASRPDAASALEVVVPPTAPQIDLNLTVSVGAAMYGGIVDSARRLMRTADSALYSAKHAGRNCVRLGVFRGSTPAIRPSVMPWLHRSQH